MLRPWYCFFDSSCLFSSFFGDNPYMLLFNICWALSLYLFEVRHNPALRKRGFLCICGRSSCDVPVPKPNNQNSYTPVELGKYDTWMHVHLPPHVFSRPMSNLHEYSSVTTHYPHSYLLGLLAKIKCSICSYQLNL